MICQQCIIMFLSIFQGFTRINFEIHSKCDCVAHLGPHAFEDIIVKKLFTTMFSFSNGLNKEKHLIKVVFHRLIDYEKKIEDIERYQ